MPSISSPTVSLKFSTRKSSLKVSNLNLTSSATFAVHPIVDLLLFLRANGLGIPLKLCRTDAYPVRVILVRSPLVASSGRPYEEHLIGLIYSQRKLRSSPKQNFPKQKQVTILAKTDQKWQPSDMWNWRL